MKKAKSRPGKYRVKCRIINNGKLKIIRRNQRLHFVLPVNVSNSSENDPTEADITNDIIVKLLRATPEDRMSLAETEQSSRFLRLISQLRTSGPVIEMTVTERQSLLITNLKPDGI